MVRCIKSDTCLEIIMFKTLFVATLCVAAAFADVDQPPSEEPMLHSRLARQVPAANVPGFDQMPFNPINGMKMAQDFGMGMLSAASEVASGAASGAGRRRRDLEDDPVSFAQQMPQPKPPTDIPRPH